ncbi:hypothetical protein B0J12DRAFT_701112 [Macrophomina phaseolina]|uniref:Uncharacterized protein n=1 Tax=Macrophomina phaseolina TaxID=35725 RepID=A0ABQ8G8U7_9PEZI|nr:hypothetical protein B0J12DRAFT_701112 [Macrophomina phaseolina]
MHRDDCALALLLLLPPTTSRKTHDARFADRPICLKRSIVVQRVIHTAAADREGSGYVYEYLETFFFLERRDNETRKWLPELSYGNTLPAGEFAKHNVITTTAFGRRNAAEPGMIVDDWMSRR